MNKRLVILLRLADVPPPYGTTVSDLAHGTRWVAASLYTDIYALEQTGLVQVSRQHYPMVVRLVEHPDLAAMRAAPWDEGVTVPDDPEDA